MNISKVAKVTLIGLGVVLSAAIYSGNKNQKNAPSSAPKTEVQAVPIAHAGLNCKVVSGLVKDDPLVNFSLPDAGQLCYSFTKFQVPPKDCLVLRQGEKITTFDLSGNGDGSPFAPTFSPDGRLVGFLMGEAESEYLNGTLYVLAVETGAIREVSKRKISFSTLQWSRDGRFLAFIEGGDASGEPIFADEFEDHPSLWMCDVATGREWQAAKDNDGLNGGFIWGKDDELFFSARTKDGGSDIYKVKPNGTKTRMLRDARSPLPSPSGQEIAFLRLGHPFVWPAPAKLCVANSNGAKPRILRIEPKFNPRWPPVLVWSYDDAHLFRVEGGMSSKRGEAVALDAHTGVAQKWGQFQSATFQDLPPSFDDLHEENGGLRCFVTSIIGNLNENYYKSSQSFQSIDAHEKRLIWALPEQTSSDIAITGTAWKPS